VVTSYDGRLELVDAFVRRTAGEMLIALWPEDDDARRMLHALAHEGYRVHVVEAIGSRDDRIENQLVWMAAHHLQSTWIVRLALDEVLHLSAPDRTSDDGVTTVAHASQPGHGAILSGDAIRARGPLVETGEVADEKHRGLLRTTTVPGPAHKEHIAFIALPGRARSVFVPLHGLSVAREIRLTLDVLGCALVDVDAVRLFRHGDVPLSVQGGTLASLLRVVGGAHGGSRRTGLSLRALAGPVEMTLDAAAARFHGSPDAIELRITVNPLDDDVLGNAALARVTAPYREPWSAAAVLAGTLAERADTVGLHAGRAARE
jgi:hypothetical protein